MLLRNKQEQTTDMQNNGESQNYYAKWKKLDMKEYLFYNFLHTKVYIKQIYYL